MSLINKRLEQIDASATPRQRAAFEATAAERAALKSEELAQLNVDAQTASGIALASLEGIRNLEVQTTAIEKPFDLTVFAKIETYAWALFHAQARFERSQIPAEEMATIVEEATQARALLIADANALMLRGRLPNNALKDLKGPVGYANLTADLNSLASLFENHWSEISQYTQVTEAEISRAQQIAELFHEVLSVRERSTQAASEIALDRQRAFTLFERAYDQIRRMAVFVRWDEKDASKLVPSLYTGRGGRKKTDDDRDEETEIEVLPAPTPVGEVRSNGFNASNVVPSQPGLPGGSPFI